MDTLAVLQNRIDFCGIITAERCNPNGDPIDGNVPRQDYSGHGIMSDVCIKRKIRDRLYDNGHDIFVIKQENLTDGIKSLHDRVKSAPDMVKASKAKDSKRFLSIACEKWIDVRTFGQVFAFRQKDGGVSESVRGPVSIQDAVSLDVVNVIHKNLTKSVNSNDAESGSGKSSDTFGVHHLIDRGAYVFRGSMYPQLAKITGFTYGDALLIKESMLSMLKNDASAARPSGSMTLDKLYWWEHNSANGQYSPAKVFRSLHLESADEYPYYTAVLDELPNLNVEILEGW